MGICPSDLQSVGGDQRRSMTQFLSSYWFHFNLPVMGSHQWLVLIKLQSAQNSLTHAVLPSLRHLSASERLSYLHWLPVNYRIQFKIATLTYKTLAICQPAYLYNLLQVYHPSWALRSSTQQLLHVPYMSTDFGRCALSYSSPATWNSIPISIKNCSSAT